MFADIVNNSPVGEHHPVFVVMSRSGSTVSNIIRRVTGETYSHVSISFDSSLKNMYSFGSGKLSQINRLVGGFAKENFTDIDLFSPGTNYALYVSFIPKQERDAMLDRLMDLTEENTSREMKYNFIGLLYNAFKIPHKRGEDGESYFCSQFVDTILKVGNAGTSKKSTLVRPSDIAKIKTFYFVIKGISAHYDERKVVEKIKSLAEKVPQNVIIDAGLFYSGGYLEGLT